MPFETGTPPLLSIEGHMAVITLNRPEHRNRLENQDLNTLLRHFNTIDADKNIRALVLTANTTGQKRPIFSSGYHMAGFDHPDYDPHFFETIPNTLAAVRPITICALNGSVYGGACDLFLACDIRLAQEGVELKMPATALGLHYYPNGLQRFVSRLGLGAAKRAFYTARPLTDQQLWATGCLEELCPPSELANKVDQLAREIGRLAPLALEMTKQSINELEQQPISLERFRAREIATLESRDFQEGRLAFQEKRAPVFLRQ